MKIASLSLATLTALVAFPTRSQALTVLLDYTFDVATDNFFATHLPAKAALEQARNDIQNAIASVPNAITNDVVVGTSNITTATYDFSHGYTNPSTGAAQTIALSTMLPDQVTIFVGMRELTGPTLGQGGPGSLGVGVAGSGVPADWPAAMAVANAAATTERLRGTGPQIGTLTGSIALGGTNGPLQVSYGSAVGNLWFDNDSDDNGVADGDLLLDTYWHYDYSTSVESTRRDFYSVALHELVHALGIGTSESWTAERAGTNWLGSEVIALNGTGVGVIDPAGGHIAAGIISPRLSDGVPQEALMAPSLTIGTRKGLTELDLAFLRDINWDTVAIPEPGTSSLAMAALASLLARRRRVA